MFADPNGSNPEEVSALSMGAMACCPECVAVLLKAGANPNTVIKVSHEGMYAPALNSRVFTTTLVPGLCVFDCTCALVFIGAQLASTFPTR